MRRCAFKFLLFVLGMLSLDMCAAEVYFDNFEKIKNNYDFILFTLTTSKKGGKLIRVECDNKVVFPMKIVNPNGIIKGMIWLTLGDAKSDPDFVIKSKDVKLKFIIAYGYDKEILDRLNSLPDVFDELPKDGDIEVIYKDISLPNYESIKQPSNLDAHKEIAKTISEKLIILQMEPLPDISCFGLPDNFLSQLKKEDKGDSPYVEVCSLVLILNTMNEKISDSAKKALQLTRGCKVKDEVYKKIEEYLIESSPELDAGRKTLLRYLNNNPDSYLYHLIYPTCYVGSFVETYKFDKAKSLLDEYALKHVGYNRIVATVRDNIKPFMAPPITAPRKFEGMDFDKIIVDEKMDINKKMDIFQSMIEKIIQEKELTPEAIAKIIEKIMELGVKHAYTPAFSVLIDLLPDDQEKPFDLEWALAYEKGLVIYYQKEDDVRKLLQVYGQRYKTYYTANRSAPLSLYGQTLKLNPETGKYLYDYLKQTKSESDNILENFVVTSPETYKEIINLIRNRFGELK